LPPPSAPSAALPAAAVGERAARAAGPMPEGTKARIHRNLRETCRRLYTLKAWSRFTVALLGCPVEGLAVNTVAQIRVGDVKALIFQAGERVEMRIAASEPGSFTLDIFTPGAGARYHFGPIPVHPRDRVQMTLISDKVVLRHELREIPFSLA